MEKLNFEIERKTQDLAATTTNEQVGHSGEKRNSGTAMETS
jgi:hypothetical protein